MVNNAIQPIPMYSIREKALYLSNFPIVNNLNIIPIMAIDHMAIIIPILRPPVIDNKAIGV